MCKICFELISSFFNSQLQEIQGDDHELKRTPDSACDVESGPPKSGPTNPDSTGSTTIVTISEQCDPPNGHVEVGIPFDPSDDVPENPPRNPVTSTDRSTNPLIMTDILTNPDLSLPVTSSSTPIGDLLDTSFA